MCNLERIIVLIKKFIRENPVIIIFSIVAFLILLTYCLFTGHIWEDFFITFKFSENLCKGYGLVYEPGTKIHGFTSPLGVLLPALCYFLSGMTSYLDAIWLFRILFCLPAFICGGIFLIKLFKDSNEKLLYPAVFVALFYVLESKSVMFSVNGMETAFMLMFFSWSMYLMFKGTTQNWLYTGLAWAGLMWTRPDSFIYVGAMAIASIIFADTSRMKIIKSIFKASAVTTLVYLPWFVWAWVYYGTPVPHTVTAKSAVYGNIHYNLIDNLLICLPKIFAPTYPVFSEWPMILKIFSYSGGVICFIFWVFPIKDRFTRLLSFIFFLLTLYLSSMPYAYPWYFPPVTVLGLVIIVKFIVIMHQLLVKKLSSEHLPKLILTAISCYMVVTFLMASYQFRVQQKEVENGVRMQIGKWLKGQIGENDRIYLECLGYIGYFSGGKMLDYPGLASPSVTKLLKNGRNFVTVIEPLQPEWIVLRPDEFKGMYQSAYFRNNYDLAKVFTSVEKIKAYKHLPGESVLLHDASFLVFKEKATTTQRKSKP